MDANTSELEQFRLPTVDLDWQITLPEIPVALLEKTAISADMHIPGLETLKSFAPPVALPSISTGRNILQILLGKESVEATAPNSDHNLDGKLLEVPEPLPIQGFSLDKNQLGRLALFKSFHLLPVPKIEDMKFLGEEHLTLRKLLDADLTAISATECLVLPSFRMDDSALLENLLHAQKKLVRPLRTTLNPRLHELELDWQYLQPAHLRPLELIKALDAIETKLRPQPIDFRIEETDSWSVVQRQLLDITSPRTPLPVSRQSPPTDMDAFIETLHEGRMIGDATEEGASWRDCEQAERLLTHSCPFSEPQLELLQDIFKAEQALIEKCPVPAECLSNFHSVDAIRTALEKSDEMPLLLARTLSSMAVLRQTAHLVVHHGLKTAWIYLKRTAQGLLGLLGPIIAMLRGPLEKWTRDPCVFDHPKQPLLRSVVLAARTGVASATCLVIGDPVSFFLVYPVLYSAGLKVCHLDKHDSLLKSPCSAYSVEDAVMEATRTSDVVVVSLKHATMDTFPFDAFDCLVLYASEESALSSLKDKLEGCKGQCHVFLMEHLELAHARDVMEPNVFEKGITKSSTALNWPLIISSSMRRPLRGIRELYQAALAMECKGAVIVEKPLSLIDAILSPSTAVVISVHKDQHSIDIDEWSQSMVKTIERISYAFSKLILVIQCPSSNCSKSVDCRSDALVSTALYSKVGLQIYKSTCQNSTVKFLSSLFDAALEQWAAQSPAEHYTVQEIACPKVEILERFYALNPHSAAALASCGFALKDLFHYQQDIAECPMLARIPTRSLELFQLTASSSHCRRDSHEDGQLSPIDEWLAEDDDDVLVDLELQQACPSSPSLDNDWLIDEEERQCQSNVVFPAPVTCEQRFQFDDEDGSVGVYLASKHFSPPQLRKVPQLLPVLSEHQQHSFEPCNSWKGLEDEVDYLEPSPIFQRHHKRQALQALQAPISSYLASQPHRFAPARIPNMPTTMPFSRGGAGKVVKRRPPRSEGNRYNSHSVRNLLSQDEKKKRDRKRIKFTSRTQSLI